MTKEQKDLLLKDLSTRLPYGVVVNVKGFDYDYNSKLTQIYNGVGCSIQVTTNMPYDIEQVKPYLFPLSSMTEEQLFEVSKILGKDVVIFSSYLLTINNYKKLFSYQELDTLFNWFHKNHFDYRGLISMGLALDATGKNIYIDYAQR